MAQLDKLLLRFNTVAQSGVAVAVPQPTATQSSPFPPTTLNFTNATCAYNPTLNTIDITTIPGTIGPERLTAITGSQPSLVSGTRYLVDTTGAGFTQVLPSAGLTDGQWYEWTDAAFQWSSASTATHNLTLSGGSNKIEDPNYVGIGGSSITNTTVVLQTVGETFRTTWSQVKGLWYIK